MELFDEVYIGTTDIKMVITGRDLNVDKPVLRDEHGKRWVIDSKYLVPTGVTGVHVVILENVAKQLRADTQKLLRCVMDLNTCISSIDTLNDPDDTADRGEAICRNLRQVCDSICQVFERDSDDDHC